MFSTRLFTTPLLLAGSLGAMALIPAPERPDFIPSCPSPQPSAPIQTIGGAQVYYGAGTAIAFNGQDYGTAWIESNGQLKFRRLFSDGSPGGPIVTVGAATATVYYRPSLVWNGAGYGVAWMVLDSGWYQIYFARLGPDGSLSAGGTNPQRVSVVGGVPAADAYSPALAWGGGLYGVAWQDYRNNATTGVDIYATLINGDGTIANTGVSHDLVVSNAASTQNVPAIAWNTAGNAFLVVWQDLRSATHFEIYRAFLNPNGTAGFNSLTVSPPSSFSAYSPSLVDTGAGLGLAWYDSRDGNYEIYFARLEGNNGNKVGADLRLTNDLSSSFSPVIVWTGAEYGVFWGDNRTGNFEAWFQRVSSGGTALGPNVQITATANMGYVPQAAFGRRGYLLTLVPFNGIYYPNYSVPVGCVADTTPPSCPANFLAYGITGTSASVSWSLASDLESDLAYYAVYRNNVLVGKTSSEYYNDTGLPLASTNNYMIQPVNAWQLQNTACTSSIYIRTNANLTLTMNKSTPDAVLNWTNAGFNNYNIFRGNDPRVMSQIGATPSLTAPDPNALSSNLSYFYSVDNPGQ